MCEKKTNLLCGKSVFMEVMMCKQKNMEESYVQ